MIIETAERLNGTETYYFAKKLKEIRQLNDEGQFVINLGIGSPDLPPADSVIEALQMQAEQPSAHGYQPYQGIPELKEAIADYMQKHYQVAVDHHSEVLPLTGSKEGIMHIAMAFLNPGDKILIPNPGYPTYEAVGKLCQAEVLTYSLSEARNWNPSVEEFTELPLDDIKLLWLNYPHMPTGAPADQAVIAELVNLARKHRFLIINDNPYNQLFAPPAFSIFQLPHSKEVALELHSMSKSHSMAGWRLGWATGRSDYLNAILKVKSNMDSGMFSAIQMGATKALKLPDSYYQNLRKIYTERRSVAARIFEHLQITSSTDQEGMFLWGRIPDHYGNAAQLSDKILKAARVFITPGFIFGSQGENY
ncbi:MAG: aminotransferase class I/II-fold pyridoxal phosphate-dependent enzyme, partial [Bacteroidota bacterium]